MVISRIIEEEKPPTPAPQKKAATSVGQMKILPPHWCTQYSVQWGGGGTTT